MSTRTLKDIAAEKAKAQALLAKLDLEAQEIVQAEAGASFPTVVELLQTFGQHYTLKQKNEISALLGLRGKATEKAAPGTKKSLAPKFQIPSGETWAGRGKQPKNFQPWLETAEGKAWAKKHPDEKYPAYPYQA
ncbi:H-NS family nucleoid-associated regulatory protein [Stenotrophomonas maltophilia]|uniref:H-NS family nucleoid-associated regulatory protein n=1 Tax=Stenotrophomonas maltophilia TaxID=40324 RepID=UPI00209B3F49|nr:H-NS family nucleoid-associated regulatory protein [Stenotrophomonas maltophilia]MCO7473034.1 H-NS histone family protein [Stenotrophomonas maltophilia]